MTAQGLITVGLSMDVVGVWLIWKFSLGQPIVTRLASGKNVRVYAGDRDKHGRNRFLDHVGVVLLMLGFTLQIVAQWLPELTAMI